MDFQKKDWQFRDIISENELNRMEDGIEEGITKAEQAQGDISAHVARTDNPHGVTKDQVGLGNVDNVKQASKSEFDAHVANTNNPHGVTKSQVGLGNVQNYGIATQAQAEAGTANNVYMTPLRTKQAIDTHASRTDNPHNVTKAQVGLGNVQNYGIATKAQAEAGTANNVYMTPLRVQEKIASGISSNGTIQTTSGDYTARIRVTNNRAVIERIGPNFTGGIRIALTKVIEMGSNDTNPNGIYSAPPGSLCFSTPSSGNAGLFYKRSGTGNTGWVPVVDL